MEDAPAQKRRVEFEFVKALSSLTRPMIRDERELARYVTTVTAFALTVALAVDVANQLALFEDWGRCLESWVETSVICLFVAMPAAYAIGRSHLDLYRTKQDAEALARTDSLTDLSNRRALIEDAEAAIAEVRSLTVFDIDRFKTYNDAYGHLVGDAVIRAVGHMLQEELGGVGLVARMGGEEFALLTSRAPIEDVVERLLAFRERLHATPILVGDVAVRVTISAGMALRQSDDGFDLLYGLADRALYEAKASGRDTFRFPASLELIVSRFASQFEPGARLATLRSA